MLCVCVLQCRSYSELQSSRCVEVLLENWRKGRSFFYSNLDLLLAPPTAEKPDQSPFDLNTSGRFRSEAAPPPSGSRKPSRLKLKRDVLQTKGSGSALPLDRFKPRSQSEAGGVSKVDSLARFFDTMSFMDSFLSQQPCCTSGPRGAKMAAGLLDEPREEEEAEIKTHTLERCYEILAAVEGLGFHGCKVEVCPMKGGDQDVMGGVKNKTCKLRLGF